MNTSVTKLQYGHNGNQYGNPDGTFYKFEPFLFFQNGDDASGKQQEIHKIITPQYIKTFKMEHNEIAIL